MTLWLVLLVSCQFFRHVGERKIGKVYSEWYNEYQVKNEVGEESVV